MNLKSFTNRLSVLSILASLIYILSISSCRKIKDVDARPAEDDLVLVEKFFRVPENASDALKKVIAEIKKQNDKHRFATSIANKYGFPGWDKSLANVKINNSQNARGLTDSSLQLFLIPFRGADSSVTSYLLCSNNDGSFAYRYYRKDDLSKLYAANDSIKQLRSGLLSVFGYFEKTINDKDSIYIGGIYNKNVKNVSISFGNTPAGGRVTDGVEYMRICWLGMQAARVSDLDVCYDLAIWNSSVYNIGWGSYGSGGDGTSGGTPNNIFPDGYVCPDGEWWCLMGQFRYIDGILLTPESYPGINENFPWLWWENPDYDFVAPSNLSNLDLVDYLKCFTNDPTSTYRIIVAVDQPVPGSRTTYTQGNGGSSSSKKDVDVGHTFLILEQVQANGTSIIRNLGFYPSAAVNPFSPSVSGEFINDQNHHWDIWLSTSVTGPQFTQFLEIIKNSQNDTYNLNTNNCSTYCTNKLSEIGINLPETIGNWPGGGGVNPGDLGEDIRTMQLTPNQSRNTTGGSAPINNVTC